MRTNDGRREAGPRVLRSFARIADFQALADRLSVVAAGVSGQKNTELGMLWKLFAGWAHESPTE